jgi:hypothetical protein
VHPNFRRPPRLSGADHPLRKHPELAVRGEAHGQHKLTEADVREIRARRRAGELYTDLARIYGVHRSTARAIFENVTWRHVQ